MAVNEEVEQLLGRAALEDYSSLKTRLCQEAVQLADAAGDEELADRARHDLVSAATFNEEHEIAMVHFAWRLARYDRISPDSFDYSLMWSYKWIMDNAADFPEIPRSRVEEMLADFTRRLSKFNCARTIAKRHLVWYKHLKDETRMREWLDKWHGSRRDVLSDCTACDANFDVGLLVSDDKHEEAIKLAHRMIAQKMKCAVVPSSTHAKILVPLLRLERYEEAFASHRAGMRAIRGHNDPHRLARYHIEFLGLTHNWTRGLRLIERFLHQHLALANSSTRFEILSATKLFLQLWLTEAQTRKKLRIGPIDNFIKRDAKGLVDGQLLMQWCAQEAELIAQRFDERNGSDTYTGRLKWMEELASLAKPQPFDDWK